MKAAEVRIGGVYRALVSGKLTDVRIVSETSTGLKTRRIAWNAVNVRTGRDLLIRSAMRLREEVSRGQR